MEVFSVNSMHLYLTTRNIVKLQCTAMPNYCIILDAFLLILSTSEYFDVACMTFIVIKSISMTCTTGFQRIYCNIKSIFLSKSVFVSNEKLLVVIGMRNVLSHVLTFLAQSAKMFVYPFRYTYNVYRCVGL